MDNRLAKRQVNSIALSIILLTSTFTIFGAFMFFPVQEADAQGLQLRVSAAERPQFQNRFFGAQIVQVVIDDPAAPDPDDNTVGLQVRGVSVGRVHLQDGLWYHFFAEEDAFGIYLDVVTDGVRDSVISVSNAAAGLTADVANNPATFVIGATTYTHTGGRLDSFVSEITRVGTTIFAELDQADIFPTLPNAFCDSGIQSGVTACPAANTNPDINIPGDPLGESDAAANNIHQAAATSPFGNFGSTANRANIDWPWIQLIPVEETDVVSIRAGSSSVDLVFDDFAAGISTKLDRTAAYPVNSELIVSFSDNMYNINPVEEDLIFFALNANTGSPSNVIVQPRRGFDPASTGIRQDAVAPSPGQNFPDLFGPTSVGAFAAIDFDGRQVLELDAPEGISSVLFLNALDVDTAVAAAPTDIPAGIVRQFATEPFTHDATNARLLTAAQNFGAVAGELIDNSGNGAAAGTAAVGDLPTILVIESDPNTSYFESINEASGSRADVFAGANDRVASFDYFDIIASAPMTQHDGFSAVDREIYNSADRQVVTVTDPDQNLRSRISETLDARLSKAFIPLGDPIPVINTRAAGGLISDPNLNRVNNIYEANFLPAGADVAIFGLDAAVGVTGGDGSFLRVDANGNTIIADEGAPPADANAGDGTETFHADGTAAGGPDIELVPGNPADTNANDFAALRFRTNGVTGIADGASAIIIDTNIPLSRVDDLATSVTLTGQQILDQVRLDNQQDGTGDNLENFLEEVARIYIDADADNVFDAGEAVVARTADLVAGTTYRVDIPLYNLIHIDTNLVNFITAPVTTVVQVQAVRNACATSAVVGTAFNADGTLANNCVIATATANANRIGATQIVDFTPFEAADTDGDNNALADDNYTDADLLDPLTGLVETGYDRDPLTAGARVGVGSFRVLDLVDTVNAAALAGVTLDNTVLRFTVLFLDGAAVPEPAEIISRANTISTMILDIDGMMVTFSPPSSATAPDAGVMNGPGTFNNFVYRLETDEASSNSSIFSASADYFTVNQFDTISDALNDHVTTGDPIRLFMPNRFIPPNRIAASYLDNDIVAFFRTVSATYIYETVDGAVEWDRSSYSFGQDAFLTLTDEDLNRRPDAIERYNLNNDNFLFFEIGTGTTANQRVDTACVIPAANCFNNQIDATLLETGPNTGTFVAQITMPATTLIDTTPGALPLAVAISTNQGDLEANYVDIRDISSNTLFTFTSIANIRTTLGDVVLDRAAYPPGAIMYVEIHDNDFNTDVDIRENIGLRQVVITATTTATIGNNWGAVPVAESTRIGPDGTVATPLLCDTLVEFVGAACGNARPIVEITVFTANGARLFSMLPVGLFTDVTQAAGGGAGLAAGVPTRFGTGIAVGVAPNGGGNTSVLPILDRNGQIVQNARETGPNTGIFEFETRLPGPANADQFPITLPAVLTAGTLAAPVIASNQPIQVTFLDPADSAGDTDDVEELATFLTNTSRLRTDKLEYGLGENIQVMIEEPDLNLDSRNIENIAFTVLDLVTDKFDTEFGAGNFGTALVAAGVSTDLPNFRETEFNSAVFSVVIEDIPQTLIDRGEVGRLIYLDQSPSGSGTQIRIQYNFLIVAILPEIIFDKEEYTPFDEVIVSIISPDSNTDRDRIETLGRTTVSSSSQSIGTTRQFIETGPNTGIFEEDFDLHPTNGVRDLQAIREDGVTVEFRIDTDTVATKSVFVNFHVGQVMFDKDAFRLNERGVMRVIDPDANRNPDTIDTIAVRFWSTTDRGGLQVTLRETGDRTGIFEEIVTFTPDEESTGTRLRVTEGDTITAKYTDTTLPAPAALAADNLTTVEVEELFASALIGAIVPPLERAVASDPELVDQTGAVLADVSAGSQVLIQSTITNSQTKKQPFAYIVQIKDGDGVVSSLSWVTGELPAKESLAAAQSWIPEVSGSYTVEVFVWASVDNPTALSPVRTTTVTVS